MENIILIKMEMDSDIHNVFNMFTVNELLEEWLTEKADIEPEVGGKYELFWEPENREINSTIGCKITGIEEDRFISFEWKGPVQFQSFMNSVDPLTHVIIFFIPSSDVPIKTTIYLFHVGWRKSPEWQQARNYFDKVWRNVLRELNDKIKNNSIRSQIK